ncbi:hypothetical protein SGO26_30035 (plasmid) [Cupriavidus metallidurans]|jgi:hypothetical protein|uniref:hypothetical protein n=1 Tax=Cupriavidus TaxID=106589 RepID=UPI0011F07781|nr:MULTISPECIES: hypothetical protein [Cupriavidus]MWL91766.1 hypothetical protein [Cupriavidus sp. SW-Y-13]
MELVPIQHLPYAYRCALEVFAASGDRTKARLGSLVEHYLKSCGLSDDPHRTVYEESVYSHAKKSYGLGADQGF